MYQKANYNGPHRTATTGTYVRIGLDIIYFQNLCIFPNSKDFVYVILSTLSNILLHHLSCNLNLDRYIKMSFFFGI